MKHLLRVVMTLLLFTVVLLPSYSMRYDWSEETFRLNVSATSISIGTVEFYEGRSVPGAVTGYSIPLSFGINTSFRYCITNFLAIGADAGLVFEMHAPGNLKTAESLLIYRLYPALAIEFMTKSAYFTDEYRRIGPETPSIRLEGSVLLGVSPGIPEGMSASFMPFVALKPAGVLSVKNIDMFLSLQLNALWGAFYKSPYKVLVCTLNASFGIGWRF